MSRIYIPSLSEILAVSQSRGEDSDAPHLWKGLVGAWTMQEGGGGTVYDVSGHGMHGTQQQSDQKTKWTTSNNGRALEFDGTDDYVDVGDQSAYDNMSVSASGWLYVDNTAVRNMIISDWDTDGGNRSFVFEVNAGGSLRAFVSTSGLFESGNVVNGSTTLNQNQWYCVCFVHDLLNGEMSLYVNGVEDGKNASAPTSRFAGNARSLIGAEDDVSASTNEFDGQISDVRLYERALTPGEIRELYQDPWAAYRLSRTVAALPVSAAVGSTLASGSYAVTGQTVSVTHGTSGSLNAGTYDITGSALSTSIGHTSTLSSGVYDVSGDDVIVSRGFTSTLGVGSLTVSGTDIEVDEGITSTLGSGAYAVGGQTIDVTSGVNSTLESGIFTITGTDIAAGEGVGATLDPGSFTVSGTALSVTRTVSDSLLSDAYMIAGSDISVLEGAGATLGEGAIVISGDDITATTTHHTTLGSGAISISGQTIGGVHQTTGQLSPGSMSVAGTDISVMAARSAALSQGAYSIEGQSIVAVQDAFQGLGSGAYIVESAGLNTKRSFGRIRSRSVVAQPYVKSVTVVPYDKKVVA